MKTYKDMTTEEIKRQLEWSDQHEFSYGYSIWAFEEIERLNNIIEKYKKHLKEYDEWLDYNTKIGNLYWYDATPFPKLELKGVDKE